MTDIDALHALFLCQRLSNINKSVVLVTGANGGLSEHFVAQALERGADRALRRRLPPQKLPNDRSSSDRA